MFNGISGPSGSIRKLLHTEEITTSVAAVEITNAVDWTAFKKYLIDITGLTTTSDGATPYLRLTDDGGTSWLATNYKWWTENSGGYTNNDAATVITLSGIGIGNAANELADILIELMEPGDAAQQTRAHVMGGAYATTNRYANIQAAGFHTTAAAHNGIQLYPSAGNFDGGLIKIYGEIPA